MAQWINLFQNNRFILQMPTTFFVRKIGPVHITEPGLTAGRQVADEIQVNLEFLKITVHRKIITAVKMHSRCFSSKIYCKACFIKCKKFMKPYDFLLIPTIKYLMIMVHGKFQVGEDIGEQANLNQLEGKLLANELCIQIKYRYSKHVKHCILFANFSQAESPHTVYINMEPFKY